MQQNVKSRQNVMGRDKVSGFVAIKSVNETEEEIRPAVAVKKTSFFRESLSFYGNTAFSHEVSNPVFIPAADLHVSQCGTRSHEFL